MKFELPAKVINPIKRKKEILKNSFIKGSNQSKKRILEKVFGKGFSELKTKQNRKHISIENISKKKKC